MARRWYRWSLGTAWFTLGLTVFVSAAYAAVITSITITPSVVVVRRTSQAAVTTDNAPPPSSYAWYYDCDEAGCQGPAIPYGINSPTVTSAEPYVGIQTIACEATFTVPGLPPNAPTVLTATAGAALTVVGPDTDVLTSGPGISANPCVPHTVEFLFEMRHGTDTIGASAAGTVEERIERPAQNFDSGWTGTTADFTRQGYTIVDKKSAQVDNCAAYNAIPNGTVIDDFFQTNRFLAVDCCGNTVAYVFPRRHFQRVKDGANSYTTILIP